MTFEWKDEYSVKIAEIDEQHKKLFDLIIELESCSKESEFETIVKDVLENLMEYVNIHFETEEYYFDKANYEETAAHKDIHTAIKLDLNEKINTLFARKITALDIVGLHNFLIDWLQHHILEQDQKYVQHLESYHDL